MSYHELDSLSMNTSSEDTYSYEGIRYPGEHDILFGRGGE